MKLSGWKRIGIAASVVWVLGAPFYMINSGENVRAKHASEITLDCEAYISSGITTSAECDKRGNDYLTAPLERVDKQWIATVAFVPVLVAWGFVYLVLSLFRWIRRGFAQQV
jgi:hypothetical protein